MIMFHFVRIESYSTWAFHLSSLVWWWAAEGHLNFTLSYCDSKALHLIILPLIFFIKARQTTLFFTWLSSIWVLMLDYKIYYLASVSACCLASPLQADLGQIWGVWHIFWDGVSHQECILYGAHAVCLYCTNLKNVNYCLPAETWM